MKIKSTVLCLPVRDLPATLSFYQNVFGVTDAQIEEGIITLDLPNLSLFLMEKPAFETYSKKVGREASFPGDKATLILSCAVETREDVDSALVRAPRHGGNTPAKAGLDEASGGYIGYITDPDDYLWELVHPKPR